MRCRHTSKNGVCVAAPYTAVAAAAAPTVTPATIATLAPVDNDGAALELVPGNWRMCDGSILPSFDGSSTCPTIVMQFHSGGGCPASSALDLNFAAIFLPASL